MRGDAEGVPDVDHVKPRTQEDKEVWKKRDPILLLKDKLLQQGILTEDEIAEIDGKADTEVAELDKFQEACPVKIPGDASVLNEYLYAK